jgi:fructokinase
MIVVCGEALVDVFVGADTAGGIALEGRLGGSPYNVAIGLARLGEPVAFFGALSKGLLGDRLARELAAEGVDLGAVVRVDAPTTLGLVGLDAAGVAAYAFYGNDAADRLLGIDALDLLPPAPKAIHLGSFSTVVGETARTLDALVDRARGRTLLSFDANVRTTVEPDVQRWRQVLDGMLGRVDVVKVSTEDLDVLRAGQSLDRFAAEAIGRGASLVVVTNGSAGASAWTARCHAAAMAPTVDVLDTVGAGDSFHAALLAHLSRTGATSRAAIASFDDDALARALQFAVRAAAITCTRRGADLPRAADLT